MADPIFAIDTRPSLPRRGATIELLVTVLQPRRAKQTEVGIRCREWFQQADDRDNLDWVHKTVHHQREGLPAGAGDGSVRFTIPGEAPFTYEGSSVRYRWEAYAARSLRLRPDLREVVVFDVRL